MEEIERSNDLHIDNDKWNCPYLLAACFNGLLTFEGELLSNGILYWQFSPKNKAQKLINQLYTKTEPSIPLLDFINATNTFWQQVSKAKNGGMNYGGKHS